MSMTDASSVLLFAQTKGSAMNAQKTGQESHHGWLRDLEKALSSMRQLNESAEASRATRREVAEEGGSAVAVRSNPRAGEDPSAVKTINRVGDSAGADTGLASRVGVDAPAADGVDALSPGMDGGPLPAGLGWQGGMAMGRPPEAVAEYHASATQTRYASSAMSLMSAGGKVCNVAIRDLSITLESELQLTQMLKSNLRTAGFEMGQLWFNGRAVYTEDSRSNHDD